MSSDAKLPKASVLTLVRGRQRHFNALLQGLSRQTCLDIELIVASMQPTPPEIALSLPFPVSVIFVPGDKLPLAAARNAAAACARSERLIFLDVDCIPSPDLVKNFIEQLDDSQRCLLGEVWYLPGSLTANQVAAAAFDELALYSKPHPARPRLANAGWVNEPETRALWGLSFAIFKKQYQAAGGMDENYVGYGAEETDFSERLAASGTALGWCSNALALHQHHTVYAPPLDKFDDILCNAQRFYTKWGTWCMEYWLDQFVSYGLIDWSPCAQRINVLRRPSKQEIQASRQGPEVPFA